MQTSNKKIILESLLSNDKQLIYTALEDAVEILDLEILNAIFKVYNTTEDPDIINECLTVFCIVKEPNAVNFFLESCKINKGDKLKKVLSACWQSGLDFKTHLLFLNEQAITKDFETSFEAITILENIEPPFDIVILNTAIKNIEDTLKQQPSDKINLMESLIVTLKNFKLKNYTNFNNN